jgi:hypothetical protein
MAEDKRIMFMQEQFDDLIDECEKMLDRIDRLTKIKEDLREEVMALRDQVIVAKGDIYL